MFQSWLNAGLRWRGVVSRIAPATGRCVAVSARFSCMPPPSGTTSKSSSILRLWERVRDGGRQGARRIQRPAMRSGVWLFVAGPALVTVGVKLHNNVAYCQLDVNNNHLQWPQRKSEEKEPQFNWPEFWKFLRPQLLLLVAAVIGLRSITQTVGCLVSLYLISPKLTGLMVVVMPILVGTGALIGSFLRRLSRRAQEQIAKATGVADEALGNVRTVRAFAMEEREAQIYSAEVEKSSHINETLGVGIAVFQGLSNFALNCIVLGTIFAGGSLMAGEELSAGDLMSFLVASQTVQRSMATISVMFGQVVRGLTAGARVFEFMTLEPEIRLTGGNKIPYHSLTGEVRFHNITFSYPTRPGHVVLKDFSLSLPPCKTVAIVGQSGGGKSTVAALLERFYDPTVGAVLLDGHDIRTLDPSWLRSQVIGFISQEPVLFGTSIMENIRFGKPSATNEEVYAAAKQANADGFIRSFPDGYDTVLGERGVTLSGGQKQRIAIARALIKSPSVLILDEATSALDAESERVVQEALDRATSGRTVLVIAHRLSTIQGADLICVLANGQVKEAGTHIELLKKGGLYAELIRRQTTEQQN